MNGTSSSSPVVVTPSELAQMLRQSAEIVERNEFHPLLYQTMRVLTAYAAEYAESASGSSVGPDRAEQATSHSDSVLSNSSVGAKKSVFHDVPDSVLDGMGNASSTQQKTTVSGAAAAVMKPPGGQFNSAASAASTAGANISRTNSNAPNTATLTPASKSKSSGFSLKGIKKGLQKIGEDLFVGDHNAIGGREDMPFDEYAWCDEHFTRGCACKSRGAKGVDNQDQKSPPSTQQQQQQQQQLSSATSNDTLDKQRSQPPQQPLKPCFQRPINPSSNLIANGWIDQQRRSKMRVVWKNVLASLVEGRRPGEETTLWIQRQVVDPSTGKVTGLEALHQVPMKWLEDVNYVDVYGDHRFTLKVYNIAEEFYFRTRDEQSAQSWVLTLRSARDASLESGRMGNASGVIGSRPSAKEVGGMGWNNLEDWDTSTGEKPQGMAEAEINENGISSNSRPSSAGAMQTTQQQSSRMTISELRAMAHGEGYDTRGMERQDLERIAAAIRSKVPSSGPSTTTATSAPAAAQSSAAQQEEARAQEEADRKRKEMEERHAAEQVLRQRDEAEKMRVAAELEQHRRQEEEARKRAEELEAAELRRRQEEDRQRQVEQQAAEIKRRQEEERKKRMAELQAAEMKRRQEEEIRRQQQQQQQANYNSQTNYNSDSSGGYRAYPHQLHPHHPQQNYQQQQQAQYQQQAPSQNYYNQNAAPSSGGSFNHHQQQHQGYQQSHQQPPNQQYYNQNASGFPPQGFQGQSQPPPSSQQAHQPKPQQQPQGSVPQGTASAKYMEDKNDDFQSASTLQIKRNILIHWALQPPNLNVLRPIDQLIMSIHTAMPPSYGVSAHEYFTKFTPITRHELYPRDVMGNHPDETKLKKAVRKVRVFLHPDKLPRDLSADQQFMARMLWDITSDSWEEFLKHKDELDWIRS